MTLVLPVPGDLADALESEPRALSSFERLSYSGQRSYVDAVEGATTARARRRRVARAVGILREERAI